MRKKYWVLIIVLLILAFLLGMFFNRIVFTGRVVEDVEKTGNGKYSWTKAICNNEKECIDVLIKCEDRKVVGIEPVSKFIENPENWIDPRGNAINDFCE